MGALVLVRHQLSVCPWARYSTSLSLVSSSADREWDSLMKMLSSSGLCQCLGQGDSFPPNQLCVHLTIETPIHGQKFGQELGSNLNTTT